MVAFVLLFFFIFPQAVSAEKLWQAQNFGLNEQDIRSLSIFHGDQRLICAGGAKEIYLSQDSGHLWQSIFSLKPQADEINFVTFDSANPQLIYAATTGGLLVSRNQGRDWQKIFSALADPANKVNWVALGPSDSRKIYLASDEGLYLSEDEGISWRRANGGLPRSAVTSLAIHPANPLVIYLANTYGLFKTIDGGRTWSRIYVTSLKTLDTESEDEEDASLAGDSSGLITCVIIDQTKPKRVLLATGSGALVSEDAGDNWQRLPGQGLINQEVNFIVLDEKNPGVVYAATKNGAFEFLPNSNAWRQLYQGLTAGDVRSLALNPTTGQLLAATDQGIFATVEQKAQEANLPGSQVDLAEELEKICRQEPTIQEVQQAALIYGEVVAPEQIKNLRRSARMAALLPDVSLDYDRTIQEGGTGSHFGDFAIGPRAWGCSLSWDIGDLVFNEQLRLIDSNTRLAVQLRDDILTEITRLYYERRKLQTENILTPPKNAQENLTRQLRLEELTANIDGLTGGFFSRYLK